jgi:hypothetical protein
MDDNNKISYRNASPAWYQQCMYNLHLKLNSERVRTMYPGDVRSREYMLTTRDYKLLEQIQTDISKYHGFPYLYNFLHNANRCKQHLGRSIADLYGITIFQSLLKEYINNDILVTNIPKYLEYHFPKLLSSQHKQIITQVILEKEAIIDYFQYKIDNIEPSSTWADTNYPKHFDRIFSMDIGEFPVQSKQDFIDSIKQIFEYVYNLQGLSIYFKLKTFNKIPDVILFNHILDFSNLNDPELTNHFIRLQESTPRFSLFTRLYYYFQMMYITSSCPRRRHEETFHLEFSMRKLNLGDDSQNLQALYEGMKLVNVRIC